MANERSYRFNHFHLLPAQRQLLVGGVPIKLGSRAFDMLLVLVERRDRVVGKHELLELVWPRLVVEDNNLQVHVLALRKLLGHPAVSTVPGRGYRFTLPVTVEGGPDAVPAAGPATPDAGASERGNLPEEPPLLYGRDDDLRTLQTLLDEHAVVTVTGAGGIGKTRLAHGAASLRMPHQAGGVWWVELAPLSDPALVPAAVAQALGLPLDNAPDPLQAVLAALRGRAALLVLDNAEHLLDGVAAFIGAVRDGAAQVKLLVTSQEVLRAWDEQVFRPGPLSLPEGDDLAAARDSGAVALFVARARAADPRFELDADNRAAVVDICRQLDGIPLAIELAAARVSLLGVHGLRQRLDERFNVLTAGKRAVMRRHQTLRAALEWSHALLTPPEQVVFRRLGVFAGGFSLAAAQSVADDEQIDGWDVIEQLGALVDKSLVVADGGAEPRYNLLETSRLYALERLAEADETDTLLRRHAEHFMLLAEAQDADISVHGQGAPAMSLLDTERANLLHALAWCDRDGDDEATRIGLRLAAALRYFWPSRALLAPGARLTLRALARAERLPSDVHRANALASAVQLLAWTGQRAQAKASCEELMQLARALDDRAALAVATMHEGHFALSEGRLDEADARFAAALDIGLAEGKTRLRSAALAGRIRVLRSRGQLRDAAVLHEELLGLQREDGHGFNLALGLMDSASFAFELGDLARAQALLSEAVPWIQGTGSRLLQQSYVGLVPPLLAQRAIWVPAVQLYAASAKLLDGVDMSVDEADQPREREDIDRARKQLGQSAFDAAWAAGQALDPATAFALAQAELQRLRPALAERS